MMTDIELQAVCRRVDDYLEGPQGTIDDIGKPERLEQLFASAALPGCPPSSIMLRSVVAIYRLGPGGVPPVTILADFQQKLREAFPDIDVQRQRLMEMAIRYGIKPGRNEVPLPKGWEVSWPGTVIAVARAIEPVVNKTNAWLQSVVQGLGQEKQPNTPRRGMNNPLRSDAHKLALQLINPEQVVSVPSSATLWITCHDTGDLASTRIEVEEGGTRRCVKEIPIGAKAVWRIDTDGTALSILSEEKKVPLSQGTRCVISAREVATRIRLIGENDEKTYQVAHGAQAAIEGPAKLALFACSCGNRRCPERHRLEAWVPTMKAKPPTKKRDKSTANDEPSSPPGPVTLWSFVSSAVTGPNAQITTGSFQQGMYFPLLSSEGGADNCPRVITARVEFKQCICDNKYEDIKCPRCQRLFDPTILRKVAREVPIIVRYPPVYAPEQRCRCTQCGNLFALTEQEMIKCATCDRCGKLLFAGERSFTHEGLQKGWREATSMVQKASRLDEARRTIDICECCENPVEGYCWCPFCRRDGERSRVSCLPTRLTTVWVRTGAQMSSLDDWQKVRGKNRQGHSQDDEAETNEEWNQDDTRYSRSNDEEDDDNE